MTDQSNAPKPPRGKSLIEMAAEHYDLRNLQVPPFRGQPAPAPLQKAAPEPVRPIAVESVPPLEVRTAAPAVSNEHHAVSIGHGKIHQTDRKSMQEQSFLMPDGGTSGLFEEFRIVKRKLLLGARESLAGRAAPNGQRILVCSPHPGEGKTFCATNLALAMAAEKDVEVVLVDADVAKPSIPGLLGLPQDKGLLDALSDPAVHVEDLILRTDIPGFFVLPAGTRTGMDSEHLSSERTAEVLDRLTRNAPKRIIVFDSPPALAASPAADLASHVGQIVLVARADSTGRSALEDSVSLLSSDAEIHLLLNAVQFSPSGRRFGAYYAQGDHA